MSFTELAPKLLNDGLQYLLSEVFSQDPLEAYFSRQRHRGGSCDNPTVLDGRLYSLDWWTGLDWSGVDWTHPKICKMPFQCRTEAKHTYLFTKVACIACFRVFPRVCRGQRSRAYLMSFNEKIRRAFIYRRHRSPAFC